MDQDETERSLRAMVESHPDDARAINRLAIFVHHVRKDLDKAERLYRRAVEVLPHDVKAIRNLARFLHSVRKDDGEAERLLRTALEFAPNDAKINADLAYLLQSARKYNDAEHLYWKAIKLAPNDDMISYRFAVFLRNVRMHYAAAEIFYSKAVYLRPQDDYFNYELAEFLYRVRRDLGAAGPFYRAALELDPQNPNTIADYAAALLHQGQLTEAAEIVDRSCALNKGTHSQTGAIAALYQGLIRRLSEADDQAALGYLKSLLEAGFERFPAAIDTHIAALTVQLCREDQIMYRALATAILDERKVEELNTIERWRQIKPP